MKAIKSTNISTFAEFFQDALYNAEKGYYIKKIATGRDGDFFTLPELHPIFGYLISDFLEKKIEEKNVENKDINIIEFGSGRGLLIKDIVEYFKDKNLNIRYFSVEVGEKAMEYQKNILKNEKKVIFLQELDGSKLEGKFNIHISNEFFDALPCHILKKTKNKIKEIYVDKIKKEFVESKISSSANKFFKKYYSDIKIPEDFIFEVVPSIENVFKKLRNFDIILTVDFGYIDFEQRKPQGSIVCYRNHKFDFNPLENVYQKDISSFVDFWLLEKVARKFGFSVKTIHLWKFITERNIEKIMKMFNTDHNLKRLKASLYLNRLLSDFSNFYVFIAEKT